MEAKNEFDISIPMQYKNSKKYRIVSKSFLFREKVINNVLMISLLCQLLIITFFTIDNRFLVLLPVIFVAEFFALKLIIMFIFRLIKRRHKR